MSEKIRRFLAKEGVRSVIASLICILGGLIVGFLVLVFLTMFNKDIPFAQAAKGIITVLSGPFAAGNAKML